jgi:hypothetical protein
MFRLTYWGSMRKFIFFWIIGILQLVAAQLVLGQKPETPNILIVDGQTGATYAMSKCDQWGAFAFVGVRPGNYLLKAEINRTIADTQNDKKTQDLSELITGGLDVMKGKAIMKVNQSLFLLEMDMKETPKRSFNSTYNYRQNEKVYLVTFSQAKLDEISTLRGTLKKTDFRTYRKLTDSESLVKFEEPKQ